MKTKQKIGLLIIVLVIVAIAISTAWYFSPKIFLDGINPSDVKSISVFDGSTGKKFVIEDLEEIKYIVENIQSIKMRRGKISVKYEGFAFSLSFKDDNGESIDGFVMNSANLIRSDPFFYRCDGGLCFDYLKELEVKYKK